MHFSLQRPPQNAVVLSIQTLVGSFRRDTILQTLHFPLKIDEFLVERSNGLLIGGLGIGR